MITLADTLDIIDPLRFVKKREVVHFQRFGKALRIVQDKLGGETVYGRLWSLPKHQKQPDLM